MIIELNEKYYSGKCKGELSSLLRLCCMVASGGYPLIKTAEELVQIQQGACGFGFGFQSFFPNAKK